MKFKVDDADASTEGLGLIVLGGIAIMATIGAIQMYFDGKKPLDEKLAKLAADIQAGKILFLSDFVFPFTFPGSGCHYQDHDSSGENKSKNLKSKPYVSSQTYIEFVKRIKKFVDVIASISDTDRCAVTLQKALDQNFSSNEIVFKTGKNAEIDYIELKLSSPATWPKCDFYDGSAFDKITKELKTLVPSLEKISSHLQELKVDNSEIAKLNGKGRSEELGGRLAYIRSVVFVMSLIDALDVDVTWYNLDRLSRGIDLYWVDGSDEYYVDGNSWGS